jgi:hypothetical protein
LDGTGNTTVTYLPAVYRCQRDFDSGLHWRPGCASAETASGRMKAFWVLHQLPFLSHCIAHHCRLVSSCEKCGAPTDKGRRLLLPGAPCWNCGAGSTHACIAAALSPGEVSLGALCWEIFSGHISVTEPLEWQVFVAHALNECGGEERALAVVLAALKSRWRKKALAELAPFFGQTDLQSAVLRELRSLGLPPVVVPRLLTLDALAVQLARSWIDRAFIQAHADARAAPSSPTGALVTHVVAADCWPT